MPINIIHHKIYYSYDFKWTKIGIRSYIIAGFPIGIQLYINMFVDKLFNCSECLGKNNLFKDCSI